MVSYFKSLNFGGGGRGDIQAGTSTALHSCVVSLCTFSRDGQCVNTQGIYL